MFPTKCLFFWVVLFVVVLITSPPRVCLCVGVCAHVRVHTVSCMLYATVRSLLLCVPWGLNSVNSGFQAWQQSSLELQNHLNPPPPSATPSSCTKTQQPNFELFSPTCSIDLSPNHRVLLVYCPGSLGAYSRARGLLAAIAVDY